MHDAQASQKILEIAHQLTQRADAFARQLRQSGFFTLRRLERPDDGGRPFSLSEYPKDYAEALSSATWPPWSFIFQPLVEFLLTGAASERNAQLVTLGTTYWLPGRDDGERHWINIATATNASKWKDIVLHVGKEVFGLTRIVNNRDHDLNWVSVKRGAFPDWETRHFNWEAFQTDGGKEKAEEFWTSVCTAINATFIVAIPGWRGSDEEYIPSITLISYFAKPQDDVYVNEIMTAFRNGCLFHIATADRQVQIERARLAGGVLAIVELDNALNDIAQELRQLLDVGGSARFSGHEPEDLLCVKRWERPDDCPVKCTLQPDQCINAPCPARECGKDTLLWGLSRESNIIASFARVQNAVQSHPDLRYFNPLLAISGSALDFAHFVKQLTRHGSGRVYGGRDANPVPSSWIVQIFKCQQQVRPELIFPLISTVCVSQLLAALGRLHRKNVPLSSTIVETQGQFECECNLTFEKQGANNWSSFCDVVRRIAEGDFTGAVGEITGPIMLLKRVAKSFTFNPTTNSASVVVRLPLQEDKRDAENAVISF
jgi:hypothetical protein